MSNSKLVTYRNFTRNMTVGRNGYKIEKIFVHHMAGNLTVKQCGNVFQNAEASAHYGIDSLGAVGQYVDEANSSWHCGNYVYNRNAISIELANDGGASSNWHVSARAIAKCIDLIVDICIRNGIHRINYTGDLKGNLCQHRWVVTTTCPGGYLASHFKYIAEEVNKKLGANDDFITIKREYIVSANSTFVRRGAATNYSSVDTLKNGVKFKATKMTKDKRWVWKSTGKTGWVYLPDLRLAPTIVTINRVYQVVNKDGANVRRGASNSFKIVEHLPKGKKIKATKMYGDWVWTPDGKTGWVQIKKGSTVNLKLL